MRKLAILAVLAILGLFSVAHASGDTIIVRPSDLNTGSEGWFFFSESTPGGTGTLMLGPGTPPAGAGSAEFILTDADQGFALGYFVPSIVSLALSDVTSLEYCTYVTSASGSQAVALQLNFDDDVTDIDTSFQGRLVFEPLNSGAVMGGQWQCWDTLSGNWWATDLGSPVEGLAPQNNPQSLSTILGAFPNAGFNSSFGGLIMKAGSGWTFFDGNADKVTLGIDGNDTTFDFETEPASKDNCKNDGWMSFNFSNQGLCVKYFNQLN